MSYLDSIKEKIALIRSGKDTPADIRLVSEIVFLGQLGLDEYPLQGKIEQVVDARDEQQKALSEEFDKPLIDVLKKRAQKGDADAMVLLGQHYYGRPKGELLEGLLISETVDQMLGLPGNEDEIARQRIKSTHQRAADLFLSAYNPSEPKSIAPMYYLANLWCEGFKVKVSPKDILEAFDEMWLSGEVTAENCEIAQTAIMIIRQELKSAAWVENERSLRCDAEQARTEAVNAKAETEEMMQWIAHSTNSDLTSLELYVKREDAEISQVLTQRIRQDVETFSLMSSDPDAFISAVKQDVIGTMSLYDLICENVISTMLFMLSPKARDQKLINHRYFDLATRKLQIPSDITRKEWLKSSAFPEMQLELFKEFLALKDHAGEAMIWIGEHFGKVVIDFSEEANISMSQHGKKSAVLSYVFGQFISNALKYGSANYNHPMLSISVKSATDCYRISCVNSTFPTGQKGNRKGLKAMNLMLGKLNEPPVEIIKEGDRFKVSCQLSKVLMGEVNA